MICAALDIGSNSIHLVVVKTDQGIPFRVLARDKEVVRPGRSVARDGKLSTAAIDRAVECIRRFRRRAETYGAKEIIAVATSAVREASNRDEFLARVAGEAGVHVELLSGSEEARLIALAASVRYQQGRQEKQRSQNRLLVIDIGGGSTELAITQNREPAVLISLKLGAVRLTEQFISSDPVSDKQLRRLRAELREILTQRAPEIQAVGFDDCYGTSGTINALGSILMRRHLEQLKNRRRAEKLPARPQLEPSLTLGEVRALNKELVAMSLEERLKVPGLNRTRSEIIVAGGQLLEAIMETLGVKELTLCDWALREGVIISHLMRRAITVSTSPAQLERDPSLRGALALAQRYQADLKHAHRVAYLAQQMFDALVPLHQLGGEHRRLLSAAALLHDIGYLISHTGHHNHSAYLIQHSELTGFTASEIAIIANVARYHRSTLPKPKHPYYAALPEEDRQSVRKLAAILRITDALDRDHQGRVRGLSCEIGKDVLRIIATCSRDSDVAQWRVEERSDLFSEVYGRKIELAAVIALGASGR
ncbi:MAG TPA: Ppx/GppA phosphatase family protein [Blastocatellia bacterium]|nr:Ppx/GppA phosphatase family protein [Blastocatellia bacterium]